MTKLLTDRLIAGLRFDTRDEVYDTKARGLVLRVGARRKVWCFVYRNRGPLQRLRLGEYPAMTLAEARKAVTEQRALLDKGIDPVKTKQAAAIAVEPAPALPPAFTFADFVPTYVAFQKGRTKEWADEESKIRRHLLPVWGALPLKEIKREHVSDVLDTLVAKGMTIGVNRIQALISRMFTVALDKGKVDAHPAARLIKRFTETPRDRVLTDDELRALWSGLDAQPGPASDVVRLRLRLGQRGGETAGMLWSELDLTRALWKLPAPRTKNRKPHIVPLPPKTVALLEQRRAQVPDDQPRVFPDVSLTDQEHKALAGIHGGSYEWKDLRRTVGTRLAELGFDETTRGRVLNHARYSVTDKHYNAHAYDDEKRQALTAWETELQRILDNKPKPKTSVLPMRARR